MAEMPSSKRLRDEPTLPVSSLAHAGESTKRQKPYDEILSLLDEELEDETNNQDVSYLITSLQQELSSPVSSAAEPPSPPPAEDGVTGPDDSDEREKVMKLLLEASDDELGLPSRSDSGGDSGAETGDGVAGPTTGLTDLLDGGLWELEDEAANYYAVMQSELFMM